MIKIENNAAIGFVYSATVPELINNLCTGNICDIEAVSIRFPDDYAYIDIITDWVTDENKRDSVIKQLALIPSDRLLLSSEYVDIIIKNSNVVIDLKDENNTPKENSMKNNHTDLRLNNLTSVSYLVREKMGKAFYEEVDALESDIEFFSMYMERNKKSKMRLSVSVTVPGTRRIMNDLIRTLYGSSYDIRPMFSGSRDLRHPIAMYHLYKVIIKDIFRGEGYSITDMTDDSVREFMKLFADETGLDPLDYVDEFVDCSHSIPLVKEKLHNIINNEGRADT